jgi:hypothetical protein
MDFVNKYEEQTLARMWCQLNTWKVPPELKEEIIVPTYDSIHPYMDAIVGKIGMSACLKYWNGDFRINGN